MAFKAFLNKLHIRPQPSSQDVGSESPPARPSSPYRTRPAAFDHFPGRRSTAAPGPLESHFNAGQPNTVTAVLQVWVRDAGPLEQPARAEAFRRMRDVNDGRTDQLSLANLGLTSLPTCLSLMNITSLNVSNNRLQHLSELPPRLEMLTAEYNGIVQLPRLPASLLALSVNYNQLSHLPALPPHLAICQANGNRLVWIDALPPRLQQLSVGNNELASLPPIPPHLKVLDASANHLQKLPDLPEGIWSKGHGLDFRADLRNNRFSDYDLGFIHAHLDATFEPGSIDRSRLQFDAVVSAAPPKVSVTEEIRNALRAWTSNIPDGERPARMEAANRIYNAHVGDAFELNLKGLDLTTLPDCLSKMNVKQLSLGGNRLEFLPDLPPRLQTLAAGSNRLSSLPALPPTLTALDVGNNHLDRMAALPPRLKTLRANDNKLRELGELPATLESLHVANNRLTSLPELPRGVRQLDASSNHLQAVPNLPRIAWSTTHVVGFKADLRDNFFSQDILLNVRSRLDPRTFPGSTAHERLLFDAPAVPAELPMAQQISNALAAWAGEAPRAERNTRIEAANRIQTAFGNDAVQLDLSGLGLSSLPDCLSKLNVKQLNLDENRLDGLPTLPPGLRVLHANNNRLTALSDLPHALASLQVNGNALSHLPNLPAGLKTLHAHGNTLRGLPDLPASLQLLDVGGNKLTDLPRLPARLSVLDANGNRLTRIPELPAGFWLANDRKIYVANLTRNHFSDAELHGFKARIEGTFSPDSEANMRFVYDAPVVVAPPPVASHAATLQLCPVAQITSKEAARAAVDYWVAMNVPHEELVALRGDMDRYMLQGLMTGEEFDQRHGAGDRTGRASRVFFDADSQIQNSDLRKGFSLLRNALPNS